MLRLQALASHEIMTEDCGVSRTEAVDRGLLCMRARGPRQYDQAASLAERAYIPRYSVTGYKMKTAMLPRTRGICPCSSVNTPAATRRAASGACRSCPPFSAGRSRRPCHCAHKPPHKNVERDCRERFPPDPTGCWAGLSCHTAFALAARCRVGTPAHVPVLGARLSGAARCNTIDQPRAVTARNGSWKRPLLMTHAAPPPRPLWQLHRTSSAAPVARSAGVRVCKRRILRRQGVVEEWWRHGQGCGQVQGQARGARDGRRQRLSLLAAAPAAFRWRTSAALAMLCDGCCCARVAAHTHTLPGAEQRAHGRQRVC